MADLADMGAGIDFHGIAGRPGGDFQGTHDRATGDAQERRFRVPLPGALVQAFEHAHDTGAFAHHLEMGRHDNGDAAHHAGHMNFGDAGAPSSWRLNAVNFC